MTRRGSIPWRTAIVAVAVVAIHALAVQPSLLAIDRHALARGEIWRLWTGHFVHGSFYHLAWNVGALLVLGLLFEPLLRQRYSRLLLLGAPLVGAGTLLLQPDLPSYCGLSGMLNGIWVAGALVAARVEGFRGNMALAWLYRGCVMADLAKIAIESAAGAALFTETAALGGLPVPLAHALGSLAGALALPRKTRPTERRSRPDALSVVSRIRGLQGADAS